MATKKDIDHNITLEIDGELPSPRQLAGALTAFSALINAANKQHGGQELRFGVQVKAGSNLLGFVTKVAIESAAIYCVEYGLKAFEQSGEKPDGFNDSMLHNLEQINSIRKDRSKECRTVRIWLNKNPTTLTNEIEENINQALGGISKEYGTIEGVLKLLDDTKNSEEFGIVEPIHLKNIKCIPANDDVCIQASHLYKKRVSADGVIKYNAKGVPLEIEVNSIAILNEDITAFDFMQTRGIFKNYV
jgi:hypothetical protein